MMSRRRWQCLVGSALSLAMSATALAQGTAAPPAAPPPAGAPVPPPPPTTPTPPPPAAPPGTPAKPGNVPPPGAPQQQQPGYPQQPGSPPPGYPPPGYPPQAYPQQPGSPPPGYPQQPGSPPPGYAYPPSYYYDRGTQPVTPPPAGKHGFLAMVFVGVNSLAGSTGKNEDVGFRLGTIMGGRVNDKFSINGEFTIDILNPNNVPSGLDVSELELDIAISPLFHVQTGNVELVVGPKIGIMAYSQQTDVGSTSSKITGNGYVYGLNAGAFASISRSVSLGGLISFAGRKFSQVCGPDDTGAQTCSADNLPAADKVLGVTGAVLF